MRYVVLRLRSTDWKSSLGCPLEKKFHAYCACFGCMGQNNDYNIQYHSYIGVCILGSCSLILLLLFFFPAIFNVKFITKHNATNVTYNASLIMLFYTYVTYNTGYLCWQYNTKYSYRGKKKKKENKKLQKKSIYGIEVCKVVITHSNFPLYIEFFS